MKLRTEGADTILLTVLVKNEAVGYAGVLYCMYAGGFHRGPNKKMLGAKHDGLLQAGATLEVSKTLQVGRGHSTTLGRADRTIGL